MYTTEDFLKDCERRNAIIEAERAANKEAEAEAEADADAKNEEENA